MQSSPRIKGVHKRRLAPANEAVRHSRSVNPSEWGWLFTASPGVSRNECPRRRNVASATPWGGTLIHNGNFGESLTVGSLAVSLVESSFGSFTVAQVGSSALLSAGLNAAIVAAVAMSPVALAANPEKGPTFMPPAKPLTQNIFHGRNHPRPKARLDNGRRSCQFNDGCIQKHHADGIAANGPRSRSRSGSPLSLFLKRLHDDDEIVHAFGVDDVARLFPAVVQKT